MTKMCHKAINNGHLMTANQRLGPRTCLLTSSYLPKKPSYKELSVRVYVIIFFFLNATWNSSAGNLHRRNFYPHSGIFWESMITRVIPKVSEDVILPDVLLWILDTSCCQLQNYRRDTFLLWHFQNSKKLIFLDRWCLVRMIMNY